MRRTAIPGGWAAAFFISLFLCLAGGAAATQPSAADLAAREAARQHDIESGYQSPSFVVDGAPRPSAHLDLTQFSKLAASIYARPSRASGDPGDGPSRSLTTVFGESGMASPLGGDDVSVAAVGDPISAYLQVTNSGDYFIALPHSTSVQIYRSTDSGDTWTHWSSFVDPGITTAGRVGFLIADGTQQRIFIAYDALGVSPREVRVAYADFTAPVPTWTIVTALTDPGIDHGDDGRIDLATDVGVFGFYFVYVVAQSEDGNGADIWFARSTNQGTSYAPGYRITDTEAVSDDEYQDPVIAYGDSGYVHLAYESFDFTGGTTERMRYRRAPNSASGGAGAWQSEQTITPAQGIAASPLSISASLTDGSVIVGTLVSPGNDFVLRYSTDYGAAWPAPNEVQVPLNGLGGVGALFKPSGDVIMVGQDLSLVGGTNVIEVARSSTADLSIWTGPEEMASHTNDTAPISPLITGAVLDPSRGDRLAIAWVYPRSGSFFVRFDAEHRRDPGYANTEVGFGIGLSGGLQTPPAIAEVDGDEFGEIVFGTISGNIHVRNHDGTAVPGWPVNIGSMPFDAPVAVGRLAGTTAIVAGNTVGEVYAFDPAGNLMEGWPVTMASAADVFVSIGPLAPTLPNYVVAVCGTQMLALRYDGQVVSPNWIFTDTFTRPAAIGDVDNDGDGEIVTLKGSWLHVNSLGSGSPEAFRWFSPETFSDAPTLADVDGDGDLEIAAPTSNGKMYLLNHDGTDYSSSWPVTVASGWPLTAAALADFVGASDVEIVFGEQGGSGLVHLFFLNGTEAPFYPRSVGPEFLFMPPIIEATHAGSFCDVLLAGGAVGYSFENLTGDAPGWPRNFGGAVEETFAAGDIDNDGRKEVVVLTTDVLYVYDVGVSPVRGPRRHWPMYGNDARRRGCLDCNEIVTGIGDRPTVDAKALNLEVHPNPFNPSTTITYEVIHAGPVTLSVYDVTGRRVDTILSDVHHTPDRYTISYAASVSSGVYFLRIESGGQTQTRKIHLLK